MMLIQAYSGGERKVRTHADKHGPPVLVVEIEIVLIHPSLPSSIAGVLLWFLFVLLFSENLVVVHNRRGWVDFDCFLETLGHAHTVRLRRRLEVAIDAYTSL
jgi:hypothetical protein